MDYILHDEWLHIPEEGRQAIAYAVGQNRIDVDNSVEVKSSFYNRFGKRILDVVIGGSAFVFFVPINVVLGVITYFDVGRPIFFAQERIGKDGKPLTLVKFRNMTDDTNEEGILLPPEERVTRWGRFVRKTSLDELLNLLNVVKGDMSIIGPRPLTKKYYERFSSYHQNRHLIRPGLECPFHEKNLSEQGWQGRLDNDIWYVENMGFYTDVKLFFLLVKKVFSKKEREASANGKTGEFIGYHSDGTVMSEWTIPRKYLEIVLPNEGKE